MSDSSHTQKDCRDTSKDTNIQIQTVGTILDEQLNHTYCPTAT